MKYTKLVAIALLLLMFSCTNDKPVTNVVVANYTGVLVGSSGVYGLSFSETNSNAVITFDGQTYNLSSAETLKKGETLTLTDGTVSLSITTDANGQNPNVSFDIPGHQVSATIANATFLTENYVGGATVTKDDVITNQTTFNVTLFETNQFQAINKVIIGAPADVGVVDIIDGTYVKIDNKAIFTYTKDGETTTLALNIFEDKLTASQTDPETGLTVLELTKM